MDKCISGLTVWTLDNISKNVYQSPFPIVLIATLFFMYIDSAQQFFVHATCFSGTVNSSHAMKSSSLFAKRSAKTMMVPFKMDHCKGNYCCIDPRKHCIL